MTAAFNYDRESLGRSGSFRRANEQTLIKLISEGQVSSCILSLSLSLSLLNGMVCISLVPRPEKRAWYTLSAHAPKCTENPGTSYISVKQSVNYGT